MCGGARNRKCPTTENPTWIDELTPDPANARRHSERNIALIAEALVEVGPARSIVIDEHGVILAGNATVQAAQRAGKTRIRVIEADGEELIAVQRRGLTDDQKARLSLFDNRAAELADGWDADVLKQMVEQGVSMDSIFDPEELAAIYAAHALATAGGFHGNPDARHEPRPTSIELGQIFELGAHRIICGDSTNLEHVAQVLDGATPTLMVTDPPYGVAYDPTWRAAAGVNKSVKKLGKVSNDTNADWSEAWRLFPGAIAYVWHAGLKSSIVQASLEQTKFTLRAQIIWAKDRLALGRGDYHWQHEPCWYGVRVGAKGARTDDRSQSTLWRISDQPVLDVDPPPDHTTVWEIPTREDGGHGHGTQKPVECMARPMRNHRAPEVYDPFLGSGTSVIAASMLGRRCYAIELEPTYVQMAIDRWEAFTGHEARKVGEVPVG